MNALEIRNTTREKHPGLPYQDIAHHILPTFDISLVFVGETRAKSLNKILRNKDYIPNVLSYELEKNSGEVVICLKEAKRQAPSFEMSYKTFVGYLFIHGLSHLKGYQHGTTMERYEEKALQRFLDSKIHLTNEKKNRNRD